MENRNFELKKIVSALNGSAKGISAAMDNEDITSDEVYSILSALADRLDNLIIKPPLE